MLLVALAERDRGRNVVVLDREPAAGGVWRAVPTDEGLDVEYACHLVEQFPGVYEYLAAVTGVAFAPLEPQPVRVLPGGRRSSYASRRILLAATTWSFARLLQHRFLSLVGRRGAVDWDRDAVFRQKIRDFLRHHWGLAVRGSVIQAPVDGYAAFIAALVRRCVAAGIEFRTFDVVAADDVGRHWRLTAADGETLDAVNVRCTCSAALTKTEDGAFKGIPVVQVTTHSLLVRIMEGGLAEPVSYAAFWDDPEVVRVARIDQPGPTPDGRLFLVQLADEAGADQSAWTAIVRRALEASGVTRSGAITEVLDVIGSKRIRHTEQMPEGMIAPRFHTYSSAGNLASGVARWLRQGRP